MKFKIYGREGCTNCQTAKRMIHKESKLNSSVEYEYLNYDEAKPSLELKYGNLPKSLPVITLNDSEIVLFVNLESKLKG